MTLLFVIGMMATTAVSAQAQTVQTNESEIVFLMDEEPYCAIHYDMVALAEIISTSDTLVDDEDFYRIMESYPYPSQGSDEPAFLVLIPDDEDINIILIQEDEDGNPISFYMSTSVGWMDYYEGEEGSYEGALQDLMSMVLFIKHIDEVSK